MSWDDQKIFLAVIETGSLSAAARALGVAQPTVRARLETLEHRIGASLFTRSVRGLVPTDQALALADHARAMALASDAFERAAAAPADEVAGVVRLSVSDFVGVEVIPPMLRRLRDRHPHIAIELALSNAAADLLRQEADIAVRMEPPRQQALVARKVGAIPLGLFAHRDYVAHRGMPQTVADLAAHEMIGSDRTRADLALGEALVPGENRKAFRFRSDSHPAQLAAARAGLGIAVAQRPIALTDPQLVAVLPELIVATLDTWIVTHEDLRRLPRVRATFDHLVAEFTAIIAG